MATLIYPIDLPGPSASSEVPSERRRISDLPGPMIFARKQRDYLATQRLEWFLGAAEANTFHYWWRTTLKMGGAWFTANWPSPSGWIDVTRRFTTAPVWVNQGNDFWIVSAEVQVRGVGIAPNA